MSGAPNSSGANNAVTVAETYQPTVRVMRLYKPGFHLVSTLPYIPSDNTLSLSTASSDFALSSFLLLPDSFGDIYSGERFSAYIAVVNGFQSIPFFQVSLAIRLQTTSTVIDLLDSRPAQNAPPAGYPKTLNYNDSSDMIVQHTLTELGIHTLRVSVQYLMSPTAEPKTLRKFYRFNVLQPLSVTSNYVDIEGKPMVQCQVTNATKTPIYIQEMNFIPLNRGSICIPVKKPSRISLTAAEDTDDDPAFFDTSLHLLQPDESFAFAFVFTSIEGGATAGASTGGQNAAMRGPASTAVGHPEVRWCTTMGEFSTFRADDTLLKGTATGANVGTGISTASSTGSAVRVHCISCPSEVVVGELFEAVLRVTNASLRPIPVRLQCINTTNNSDVYYSASSPSAGSSNVATNSTKSIAGTISNRDSPTLTGSGNNTCLGLCVTGRTYFTLGKIEPGQFIDTTVNVFALCAGLHDLTGVCAVDSVTKQRYAGDALCKVFVVENDDELSIGAGTGIGTDTAVQMQ